MTRSDDSIFGSVASGRRSEEPIGGARRTGWEGRVRLGLGFRLIAQPYCSVTQLLHESHQEFHSSYRDHASSILLCNVRITKLHCNTPNTSELQ